MTEKYVIRSSVGNTYVYNTANWVTAGWTEDINEAKVFNSLEEAADGLQQISKHFKDKNWSTYAHGIHEVKEVTTLSLGEKITVDSKKDVLFILKAIRNHGGLRDADVKDMERIIAYVTLKGT